MFHQRVLVSLPSLPYTNGCTGFVVYIAIVVLPTPDGVDTDHRSDVAVDYLAAVSATFATRQRMPVCCQSHQHQTDHRFDAAVDCVAAV